MQDFHLADFAIVVAGDFQQHIAAGARREKDVVLLQKPRIVRNEVFALGGLEEEASAIGAGSQAQVVEVEFAVVVENDFVFQRGGDLATDIETDAIENGVHIFERLHAHPQSEGDLQARVARAVFFQSDFVLLVHRDEDLREGHIFLGIEVENEVRIGQHNIVDKHALSCVEACKAARFQGAALNDEGAAAEVFNNDEVAVAVGVQPLVGREVGEHDIVFLLEAEAHHFEGGCAGAVDRGVGFVVSVELVNDIDRLRGHAEARHEFVIGYDGFAFQAGPGDEVVELNAEKDFAFVTQAAGQTLSHGVEILLLLQSIAEQLAELGVNGIRVVIT